MFGWQGRRRPNDRTCFQCVESEKYLTCSSSGTFCADGTVRVALDLDAGPAVGTGARCAVVLRPEEGVAVEPLGAPLAVVARRVVLALALARLGVADVRVVVATAGYAPGEGAAVVLVVVAGLTQLAELALIPFRTLAPLDPGVLFHSGVTMIKFCTISYSVT